MSPLASCHGNLVHLKTLVKCSELADHVTLRTHVSFCLCGTGCALGMLLKQGQSSKGNCFRCLLFGLLEAGGGESVSLKTQKIHSMVKYILTLIGLYHYFYPIGFQSIFHYRYVHSNDL